MHSDPIRKQHFDQIHARIVLAIENATKA